MSDYEQRKASLGFVWIKSSQSGHTYLCPAGTFAKGSEPSEQELREHGIDESENPQNN